MAENRSPSGAVKGTSHCCPPRWATKARSYFGPPFDDAHTLVGEALEAGDVRTVHLQKLFSHLPSAAKATRVDLALTPGPRLVMHGDADGPVIGQWQPPNEIASTRFFHWPGILFGGSLVL